jgi:serine/threonine protein kinase
MQLEVGVRIDDFEIESRVGSGGMGIVYRARQVSLNRIVALKILGPALDSEEGKARFRREAQAVAKLNHAGIASIYFIGQDEQVCFFAMEYIDGASLRKVMDRLVAQKNPDESIESVVRELRPSTTVIAPRLERFDEPTAAYASPPESDRLTGKGESEQGRLTRVVQSPTYIARCCEIARDVAHALAHAHERGVIHRDIKPENLLLDDRGKVHVVDFGLARFYEDMTLTNTGSLVGTPMYMSPEQVSGRLEIDHRADIYSLGLVLYEMLTLRRPIEAATREGVLRQVMTKSRPPVSRKNPAVARALECVVHQAIAHDPDERYQSAGAFAADLQMVLDGKPVAAPSYRYKADLRDIAAERPRAITWISILMMSASFVWSIFIFPTLVIPAFLSRGGIGLVTEGVVFAVLFTTFMLGMLVPGVGLYLGYRWARWLVCAYLGLPLAVYLSNWPIGLAWSNRFLSAMLVCVVVGILIIANRRETRDWLRLAARLRAEQVQWRSAARR